MTREQHIARARELADLTAQVAHDPGTSDGDLRFALGRASAQLRLLAEQLDQPSAAEIAQAASAYEAEGRRSLQQIVDSMPIAACLRALCLDPRKARATLLRTAGIFTAALRAHDRETLS